MRCWPATLAVTTTTFRDPTERGKAFGIFGGVSAGGGAHEICVRFGGVSRQRAYQITCRQDFRDPSLTWRKEVWSLEDVEDWIKVRRQHQADLVEL